MTAMIIYRVIITEKYSNSDSNSVVTCCSIAQYLCCSRRSASALASFLPSCFFRAASSSFFNLSASSLRALYRSKEVRIQNLSMDTSWIPQTLYVLGSKATHSSATEHKTYKCVPVCCGRTLNSLENVGVVHLFEVLTKCAQLQNKQAIKGTSLKKY